MGADGASAGSPTLGRGSGQPLSLDHCAGGGSGCSQLSGRGIWQTSGHCASVPRLPGVAMTQGWRLKPSPPFLLPRVTVPPSSKSNTSCTLARPGGHHPGSAGHLGCWLKGTDLGCTSPIFQGETIIPSAPAPHRSPGPEHSSGQGQDHYGHKETGPFANTEQTEKLSTKNLRFEFQLRRSRERAT